MNRLPALLLGLLAGCTAPRDPDAVDRAATDATTPDAAPPATPAPPSTQAPPTAAEPPAIVETCDADAASGVVGAIATDAVVEQARVQAGAAVARTLAPGEVVTMEFRGDRLNLMVDEANVVTGVRCG